MSDLLIVFAKTAIITIFMFLVRSSIRSHVVFAKFKAKLCAHQNLHPHPFPESKYLWAIYFLDIFLATALLILSLEAGWILRIILDSLEPNNSWRHTISQSYWITWLLDCICMTLIWFTIKSTPVFETPK